MKDQEYELLRQSESYLKTIFLLTDKCFILLDKQNKILLFNEMANTWAKMAFGCNLIEGSNLLEICHSSKAELGQLLEKAHNGIDINYIGEYKNEGVSQWYKVKIYPISENQDNSHTGIYISALNITSQKLIESEREEISLDLIQKNKDLQQFAYIVSHNLRAPVASIIGLAREVNNPVHDETVKQKFLQELLNSAIRLDNIIQDMNKILRVKSAINEIREYVDFRSLIEEITGTISNLITAEAIDLKVEFKGNEGITTIKSYLVSIFLNLFTNSIKYKHPSKIPCINISCQESRGKIFITYKDNGLGIDLSKHKDKVFGLYKRFHPHIEGKGMGLFMIKTHVETLGGSVRLFSKPDLGVKFVIELPHDKS
ncbi:MAG: ATP-binding protein [Cytophagaceae bacterium]